MKQLWRCCMIVLLPILVANADGLCGVKLGTQHSGFLSDHPAARRSSYHDRLLGEFFREIIVYEVDIACATHPHVTRAEVCVFRDEVANIWYSFAVPSIHEYRAIRAAVEQWIVPSSVATYQGGELQSLYHIGDDNRIMSGTLSSDMGDDGITVSLSIGYDDFNEKYFEALDAEQWDDTSEPTGDPQSDHGGGVVIIDRGNNGKLRDNPEENQDSKVP